MSVAILLKNEYIKTTRRLAFVVTVSLFLFMSLMVNISNLQDALRHPERGGYGLPQAWPGMLDDVGVMAMFFAAVILILLVAAEFAWKTARQNVIDGLSKNQWFAAKLLLAVAICILFELLVLGVGGTFAASVSFTQFARPQDWKMMGAFTLTMFGFASTALMLSVLLRNAGSALAVLFVWLAVIEKLVTLILMKINREWVVIGERLPFKVFTDLLSEYNWNPAAFERAVAAARKAHRPLPQVADVHALYWFAVGYIALFTMVAYWSYRQRDL